MPQKEREREKGISRQLRGNLIRDRERRRSIFPFSRGICFLASSLKEREREREYIKKTSPRERERIRNVFRLFEHVFEGNRISISEDKQIVVCARISRSKRPLNAPLFIHRLQPRKESKKFQRARETSKELNFGGSELWAARIRTSGFARQRKER